MPLPRVKVPQTTMYRRAMAEADFLEEARRVLAHQPLACFLDSAGPTGERSGRMLLSGPVTAVIVEDDNGVRYRDRDRGPWTPLEPASWRTWLGDFRQGGWDEAGPALFPLLTYEAHNPWGRPLRPHPLWQGPAAVWLLTECTWHYDRGSETLSYREPLGPGLHSFPWAQTAETALGWRESEREYHQKINLVQKDIYEGNYYQANLSQRFLGHTAKPPLSIYQELRQRNPSPFMGVFRLADLWVISGSPERLFSLDGDRLSARPIAGTRPRHPESGQDARFRRELVDSPKERAEHLMLVDLIRNDLGRVAAPGTVQVEEFSVVESYSHVHHLVSQVSARLAEEKSLMDVIESMFPGGTITGAPKIACIRSLTQLEGEARGPYTGSMGYVNGMGRADFNILIRTLIQRNHRVCFHGGGGIVADSACAAEYMETRYKCMALMEALGIEA